MQTREAQLKAQFKFLFINSAVKTKNKQRRVCSVSSCALGEYVDACTIERSNEKHFATSATTAHQCVRVVCLCVYIQEDVSTKTQVLRLSEARCAKLSSFAFPLFFTLFFSHCVCTVTLAQNLAAFQRCCLGRLRLPTRPSASARRYALAGIRP